MFGSEVRIETMGGTFAERTASLEALVGHDISYEQALCAPNAGAVDRV